MSNPQPSSSASSSWIQPLVVHGDVAYLSGQLPRLNGQLQYVGTVGDSVDLETAQAAARLSAEACLDVFERHLGAGQKLGRLLKITGFIASAPNFTAQGQVLDAASELFHQRLGDSGRPARSAVGVAALPHGGCVEIEVIATITHHQQGS